MMSPARTVASFALLLTLGSFPAAAQQQLGCGTGFANPTQGSGDLTNMTFYNNTQSIRHIYWLDSTGTGQPLGAVMVGESLTVTAAPGTTFELADGPGNCMEVFRTTHGQYFYNIDVISTGAGGD